MEEKFFARRRKGSWLVGFFLLLGIAGAAFIILTVGTEEGVFAPQITLKTRMPNVSGLLTGAPVRLEGYRVGTVTNIDFVVVNDSLQLEITFEVNARMKRYIKKDSRCSIGTLGLLGDKFLGLTAGSPEAPSVSDGDYLPSSAPLDVEAVINKGIDAFDDLKQSAQNIREISEKINKGKGTIGLLLNDPRLYNELARMTTPITRLWEKVESGEGAVSAFFNERDAYDSLVVLLAKVNSFLDMLTNSRGTFQSLVKDDSLYIELQNTLSELRTLVSSINSGKGSAGALVHDKDLYDRLNSSIDEFNALIKDIRNNPSKYIRIKIF